MSLGAERLRFLLFWRGKGHLSPGQGELTAQNNFSFISEVNHTHKMAGDARQEGSLPHGNHSKGYIYNGWDQCSLVTRILQPLQDVCLLPVVKAPGLYFLCPNQQVQCGSSKLLPFVYKCLHFPLWPTIASFFKTAKNLWLFYYCIALCIYPTHLFRLLDEALFMAFSFIVVGGERLTISFNATEGKENMFPYEMFSQSQRRFPSYS